MAGHGRRRSRDALRCLSGTETAQALATVGWFELDHAYGPAVDVPVAVVPFVYAIARWGEHPDRVQAAAFFARSRLATYPQPVGPGGGPSGGARLDGSLAERA